MTDWKRLPKEPGVYIFRDSQGEVIYIGKAKNLRTRVRSYFASSDKSPKTKVLISHINDIDHIVVRNEVEALLLENQLIKKHAPKYNINLKDAKTYAYIRITEERFPKIHSTRSITRKGTYFGPFTDGSARNEVIQLVVRLFQIRTCRRLPKRACLNKHIGLCTAPCIGEVDREQYAVQVEKAKEFLRGETKPVERRLRSEMQDASRRQDYEVALERKRQLDAIKHMSERQSVDRIQSHDQDVIAIARGDTHSVIAHFRVSKGVISGKNDFMFENDTELLEEFITLYYSERYIPREILVSEEFWGNDEEKDALEEYLRNLKGSRVHLRSPMRGEKRLLVELAMKNAVIEDDSLVELKDALNLPQVPSVIECFDISNLGGSEVVGGMTRFMHGRPDKKSYRRFRIRTVEGQDDFAAMHETVHRRYARIIEENGALPNLIVIDGGKGQLTSALDALSSLSLQIPIVALAKREEELFLPAEKEPRTFDTDSSMMYLLRRIRDETHRYAISYQRKRREMRLRDASERQS